jgi:hypothetical protein
MFEVDVARGGLTPLIKWSLFVYEHYYKYKVTHPPLSQFPNTGQQCPVVPQLSTI